jgi:hypothetical protein
LWDRELVLLAATHAYGIVRFLEKAASSLLTNDVVVAAISNGKESLDSVPVRFIDRHLCVLAVKASYQAIRFVPDEFFDDDLAQITIASDSRAAQFVTPVDANELVPKTKAPDTLYPRWHANEDYVRSLQAIFSNSAA